MNQHATLVHRRAWRLILAVATQNDDARRTLASEIGEDLDGWYQVALVTALEVAATLDAEYMAAEAMRALDDSALDAEYMAAAAMRSDEPASTLSTLIAAERERVLADPSLPVRAREYSIGRIQRHLADALDSPPTEGSA